MNHIKPSAAPECWGKKYQDGDEECMQCRFKEECRTEMLYNVTKPQQPPIRSYAPVQPQSHLALPPPPPAMPLRPVQQWTAPAVPSFPTPSYAPTLPSPPKPSPSPSATVTTQTQPPQQPTYFQQATGASVPNPSAVPNPMTYWQRPGAVSQSYYFTQYPGEGVGTRLIKNAVLRALEAIFAELMQFFRHWTWPPNKK